MGSRLGQCARVFCSALTVSLVAWSVACKDSDDSSPAGKRPGAAAGAPKPLDTDFLSTETLLGRGNREQWYGLYMDQPAKKVGFVRLALRLDGPTIDTEMVATFRSNGRDIQSTQTRIYDRRPPHRLVRILTAETTGDGTVERRYENGPRAVTIIETVDGQEKPRRHVAPSRETARSAVIDFGLNIEGLAAGSTAECIDFELEGQRDVVRKVAVSEREFRRIAGVDTEVAILEVGADSQAPARRVVAQGGITLEAWIGGMQLRLEEQARARAEVAGFDALADGVPIDRPLGDVSRLEAITLRATVPQGFSIPDRPNQSVTPQPDGTLLIEISRGPGEIVTAEDRAAAMVSTDSIDFQSRAIAQRAQAVVMGKHDTPAKIAALVEHTHGALEKSLATHLTTASQVLAHGAGDCTEHSLLLIALARAAGVPAREVSGLLYIGDQQRRFVWHSWVEVELEGHWQAVDPSWNETRAHPGYLALGFGEDSGWLAAFGRLQLRLVDVR